MAATGEEIAALGETARELTASQGRLFNAQAVLYITIPKSSSLWSVHDLGAFSVMLALAAFDKGHSNDHRTTRSNITNNPNQLITKCPR